MQATDCFSDAQQTGFSSDDCENICTSSYHHHQTGIWFISHGLGFSHVSIVCAACCYWPRQPVYFHAQPENTIILTHHVNQCNVYEHASGECKDPETGGADVAHPDADHHPHETEHRRHHVVHYGLLHTHPSTQQHCKVTCRRQGGHKWHFSP